MKQLIPVLQSVASVCLFLGNGPRRGYQSVPQILDNLKPHIEAKLASGSMLAVFGGDTAVPERPDLGLVMRGVRSQWGGDGLRLLAVQGWEECQEHVDFVHRHRPRFPLPVYVRR
eukprot:1442461-Rhodomonas_salina.2